MVLRNGRSRRKRRDSDKAARPRSPQKSSLPLHKERLRSLEKSSRTAGCGTKREFRMNGFVGGELGLAALAPQSL